MSELTNKAIGHITDEMMKINHPFAVFIEEHLTNICTTDAVANKLLNPQKSLKQFVTDQENKMKEIARKQGNGMQSAGASDEEFKERAEVYYEITEEDKQEIKPKRAEKSNVIDVMDFLANM